MTSSPKHKQSEYDMESIYDDRLWSSFIGSCYGVINKMMYVHVLSWRTVYALIRVLFQITLLCTQKSSPLQSIHCSLDMHKYSYMGVFVCKIFIRKMYVQFIWTQNICVWGIYPQNVCAIYMVIWTHNKICGKNDRDLMHCHMISPTINHHLFI